MTVDGVRELSADAVIHVGGWHPSYARVLLIEHDDRFATILVDGNGNGAELEMEYWRRGEDGLWRGWYSEGHGPLAFMQTFQTWNAVDFVVAVGRARPDTEVSLTYGAEIYERRANEFGIWGFVHANESPDTGELPAVVTEPPAA